jgi:Tfp pilus assembly protein PilN
MRPVNLIPPEERRGERAPMRTGPLSYVVVAVLAVALVAVTLTVLVNNQVSDRRAEKSGLESQITQAQAEADRYKAFADFASVQQAREETVTTLAQSRFDWERVLREVAIVIPHDVWLTNLSASVSPDASTGSSSTSSSASASPATTESITGPSLEIQGCAAGHEAVARFLASLHDVDGVTRVTVVSSDRPDPGTSGGGAVTGSSEGCSSRGFVAEFDVIAAFDAVQLGAAPESSAAPPTGTTPTTATPAATSGADSSTTSASTDDKSQVADARQQLQQQKDSAASQSDKGHDAVNTFIPGAGSAP